MVVNVLQVAAFWCIVEMREINSISLGGERLGLLALPFSNTSSLDGSQIRQIRSCEQTCYSRSSCPHIHMNKYLKFKAVEGHVEFRTGGTAVRVKKIN